MNKYKLSQEDKDRNHNFTSTRIEERSLDCVEIEDADVLLSTIRKMIKDAETHDPYTIACCLSLACGRRTIELLKTGLFCGSDNRGSFGCVF